MDIQASWSAATLGFPELHTSRTRRIRAWRESVKSFAEEGWKLYIVSSLTDDLLHGKPHNLEVPCW